MDTLKSLKKEIQDILDSMGEDQVEIKPTPNFSKYTKNGEGKDITALGYDVKKDRFYWYTAQESYHNGDHYACKSTYFKPTLAMLKDVKLFLVKSAVEKSIEQLKEARYILQKIEKGLEDVEI